MHDLWGAGWAADEWCLGGLENVKLEAGGSEKAVWGMRKASFHARALNLTPFSPEKGRAERRIRQQHRQPAPSKKGTLPSEETGMRPSAAVLCLWPRISELWSHTLVAQFYQP